MFVMKKIKRLLPKFILSNFISQNVGEQYNILDALSISYIISLTTKRYSIILNVSTSCRASWRNVSILKTSFSGYFLKQRRIGVWRETLSADPRPLFLIFSHLRAVAFVRRDSFRVELIFCHVIMLFNRNVARIYFIDTRNELFVEHTGTSKMLGLFSLSKQWPGISYQNRKSRCQNIDCLTRAYRTSAQNLKWT